MVTDKHEAFARAVVAAARHHGMDAIQMTFRQAIDVREPGRCYEQVSMVWSQGRHGGTSGIALATKATKDIPEMATTEVEQ